MSKTKKAGNRRVLTGVVTRDKQNKSRRVDVERLVVHRRYGKVVRRTTACYVHDEYNDSKCGDLVRIVESPPLSKMKRWLLMEIVHPASDTRAGSAQETVIEGWQAESLAPATVFVDYLPALHSLSALVPTTIRQIWERYLRQAVLRHPEFASFLQSHLVAKSAETCEYLARRIATLWHLVPNTETVSILELRTRQKETMVVPASNAPDARDVPDGSQGVAVWMPEERASDEPRDPVAVSVIRVALDQARLTLPIHEGEAVHVTTLCANASVWPQVVVFAYPQHIGEFREFLIKPRGEGSLRLRLQAFAMQRRVGEVAWIYQTAATGKAYVDPAKV